MNCNLKEYKEFIDNEMLLILGQMDKATLIFDHVYLVGIQASAPSVSLWIAERAAPLPIPSHHCEMIVFGRTSSLQRSGNTPSLNSVFPSFVCRALSGMRPTWRSCRSRGDYFMLWRKHDGGAKRTNISWGIRASRNVVDERLFLRRVGYILNVTREIDNFFPGTFSYHNIRVYDEDATDLLAHWNDTYNFIVKAK